jgi:hypothetical protein
MWIRGESGNRGIMGMKDRLDKDEILLGLCRLMLI